MPVAGTVRVGLFVGSVVNAVDAKGRLSIPSFVRQGIDGDIADKTLVLNPHDQLPCKVGYSTVHSAKLQDDNERKALRDEESGADPLLAFTRALNVFGDATMLTYDEAGRIILSPKLRERWGITNLVLFIGMGPNFTFWCPRAAIATGMPELVRLTNARLDDKGIVL